MNRAGRCLPQQPDQGRESSILSITEGSLGFPMQSRHRNPGFLSKAGVLPDTGDATGGKRRTP